MVIVDVEASGVSPEKDSLVSVGAVDFANPKNRFYEECRIWEGAHVDKDALAVNGFTLEEIQPKHQRSDGLALPSSTPKRGLRGRSPNVKPCPTVPRSQSAVVLGFGHALGLGLVRGLSSASRSPEQILQSKTFAGEKTSRAEDKKTDREVVTAFLDWLENIEEKTIAGHNPSFDRDFLQATAYRYHINWPLAHRTIDLHSVCYFDMLQAGVKPPLIHGHSALNLDAVLRYVGIPEEPKPHNALTGALVETEAFGRLFYRKPFLEEFLKYPVPKR